LAFLNLSKHEVSRSPPAFASRRSSRPSSKQLCESIDRLIVMGVISCQKLIAMCTKQGQHDRLGSATSCSSTTSMQNSLTWKGFQAWVLPESDGNVSHFNKRSRWLYGGHSYYSSNVHCYTRWLEHYVLILVMQCDHS
jgi:hypothetical protein